MKRKIPCTLWIRICTARGPFYLWTFYWKQEFHFRIAGLQWCRSMINVYNRLASLLHLTMCNAVFPPFIVCIHWSGLVCGTGPIFYIILSILSLFLLNNNLKPQVSGLIFFAYASLINQTPREEKKGCSGTFRTQVWWFPLVLSDQSVCCDWRWSKYTNSFTPN